ncbi:T9SS type B sorting domain-containing protein [Halocola ammonii]
MPRFLLIITFSLFAAAGLCQLPEYEMSTTTVTDCDGILYDSGGDSNYGNNEDFEFTISTGNPLTLTFVGDFCLDNGFDFVTIHNGPNTASPIIGGPFTGTDLPGSFTASSGTVTVHFTSDNSAVFCGFEIHWNSQAPAPTPPEIELVDLPGCGSNNFTVDFSMPVACQPISETEFQLTGDGDVPVNNAIPIACTDGFSEEVFLLLGESFNYNCEYTLEATVQVPDECDSLWTFTVSTTFLFDNCGINANIVSEEDTICAGTCTDITLEHPNCLTYQYDWSNGLASNDGPHEVCPETTTTYSVEVTEVETGIVETFEYTLEVTDADIDFADQSICQSLPGFELTAYPEGGVWSGPGMSEEVEGFFEPDSANIGLNQIIYSASDFCLDTLEINIIEADAGPIQAACPETDPFALSASPPGGDWSGAYIVSDSLFNPADTGTFMVSYDALNGCQDSTFINVANITGTFDLDTLCQSNFIDTLDFSPLGGTWYGPGIVDSLAGAYDPSEMPDGDVTFTYVTNGCDQIVDLFVKPIDTGPAYISACPENQPFELYENPSPAGYWNGPALTDTLEGVYDPSLLGNNVWTENIYTAENGCTDTVFVWNIETVIQPETLYFCVDDETLPLIPETIGRQPWGGNWFGPTSYNAEEEYHEFIPSEAGIGSHTLLYEQNGCVDSMVAVVSPSEIPLDTIVLCSDQEPFEILESMEEGGIWTGSGISSAQEGIYDPAMGASGDHYIYWNAPAGCNDSVLVQLTTFQQAEISGVDSTYCLVNTEFTFTAFPGPDGLGGAVSDTIFNPASLGSGEHTITLNHSESVCMSSDSVTFTVLPELETELLASDTLICNGASVTLTASTNGGTSDESLSFSWNNGLLGVQENTDSPDGDTQYVVTVSDGCSQPTVDSISVEVLPPIEFQVSVSDTLCFGDSTGSAVLQFVNLSSYTPTWGENDPIVANAISADAGSSHLLTVTNNSQGCSKDSLIYIPAYPPLSTNFSINPNEDCIPFDQASPLNVIDLSQNAVAGIWDFDNGQSEMYEPGENPSPSYDTPGNYTIKLFTQNIGGCVDSTEMMICVANPTPIFVPDIFSPNDDGANDMLYVRGPAITTMTFQVFDRWGKMVFSSDNPDHGWDGNSHGGKMPEGVYIYHLTAKLEDGATVEQNGNVTLIR